MHVTILASQRSNSATYRVMPLTDLAERGCDITVRNWVGRITPEMHDAALACDLLYIYRLAHPPAVEVAQTARAMGKPVMWDNDDDFSTIPAGVSTHNKRGGLRDQRLLRYVQQMVRLADVVTTPSRGLAELYTSWGAERVIVVENYLSRLFRPVLAERRSGVTVGWVAGEEHRHDMRALAIDAVCAELLDRHPELRVTTVGVNLYLKHERYRHVPGVRYGDLGAQIAEFDIGIAPLDDIPFNRARSNVKVKEYAACGVPWLASPVGSYLSLGEKEGGRLVPDGEWVAEVGKLIERERQRKKLAKRALSWARTQRSIENVDRWQAALVEAIERARRRGPAPRPSVAAR